MEQADFGPVHIAAIAAVSQIGGKLFTGDSHIVYGRSPCAAHITGSAISWARSWANDKYLALRMTRVLCFGS